MAGSMSSKVKLDLGNLHKLQSKQRVMVRKVVKARATEAKRRMKSNAHKVSGALRTAVADKVKVNKGGVYAIVGVKNRHSKVWKGTEKIPNRYALLQEEQNRFVTRSFESKDVEKMRADIQAAIDQLLG